MVGVVTVAAAEVEAEESSVILVLDLRFQLLLSLSLPLVEEVERGGRRLVVEEEVFVEIVEAVNEGEENSEGEESSRSLPVLVEVVEQSPPTR